MTEISERVGVRIVGLMLIVAAISVFGLWTISTSAVAGESVFAVYLSMDLVAFAIIGYVYRTTKAGEDITRMAIFAGCCVLLLLAFAGLAV